MKNKLRNSLIIPAAILSTMLAVPAFAQTGVPHSTDNTTNPNAQNATNPDAQVPPQAPGTAVGDAQPAVPAHQSDPNGGSSSGFTTALKDTDITAKVMYGLHENDATSGADIHVTTNNGVVTLYGKVQKHHQAMEAVKVAQSTEGVREVVNQLAVSHNVNG